jgi:hypothetical protein
LVSYGVLRYYFCDDCSLNSFTSAADLF